MPWRYTGSDRPSGAGGVEEGKMDLTYQREGNLAKRPGEAGKADDITPENYQVLENLETESHKDLSVGNFLEM